jgi:D-aminopeptidase
VAARAAIPEGIEGVYISGDCGATWRVTRAGDGHEAQVSGPLVAGGTPWPVRGVDADTVEIESPTGWITATQLARVERDVAGKIVGLVVSTGRIKRMRFVRTD